MLSFAVVAHTPEERFGSLPPFVRARLDGLVQSMCRQGQREELMRGTFYYAFVVATFVLLFWTSPINVIVFAALFLGDGVADPVGRLATAALARAWCPCDDSARPPVADGDSARRAGVEGAQLRSRGAPLSGSS